ncbi:NAD(P)-dependent dehydrogenase (short-subunit alcohol dehydrogenase family) [Kibdelosporangium banguiense]|uniref:NAD(P)-dependent dehydrogenase (Short-subunit alcohol dehydrogenase family) n=1 Tax=Kibdelosporangium banguiense TaxID=1365924 RepID=A0ABS4TLA0_9PSEU|nr:SDR family oxidoreductase [Kibdelosporangium banguiense]MBP2324774.1 NAD(P)-dependent dehydrogenase (short-subunit alcohol dehydrogenase family) [Kibdelosporangium banguiense]
MLLENKTAVIYGGGGSIGGAMASAFAAEGARVFLVGRTPAKLETVADRIRAAGGQAETAVVDALDASAVNDHIDAVVEKSGSVDISVNLITLEGIFQPLADISTPDFVAAISKALTTQLITTKAAARHMVKQESGVLLFFGGSDHANNLPGLGNVQVGFDAVESLRRQWAVELAPHGIRTVTLLTGGIVDTFPDTPEMQAPRQSIIDASPLKRAATMADVGNVAAFVASDNGRSITSTQVNISVGACYG